MGRSIISLAVSIVHQVSAAFVFGSLEEQVAFGATKDDLAILAERPGPYQDIATEQDRLATEAEELDLEQHADQIRARELTRIQQADALAQRNLRDEPSRQGYTREEIAGAIRNLAAQQAQVDAFFGGVDPLLGAEEYRAAEREAAGRQRAASLADRMLRDEYGYAQELEDAEDYIRHTLRETVRA